MRRLMKQAIVRAYCHGLLPIAAAGWLVRRLVLSED